jgi:hypothetical protein
VSRHSPIAVCASTASTSAGDSMSVPSSGWKVGS